MTSEETFGISGLTLRVSKEHHFGSDAVRLAEFAAPGIKKGQVVCDLCTGCGAVPFLLLEKSAKPGKIYALDINEDAINLLRESAEINSLGELIFPVQEDLKSITQIPAGSVDIVTVNPPYYRSNDGFKRESGGQARHELLCELDDVVRAAARLLKYGGRLKMCHIPERLADVVCTLRKHKLEPKKLTFAVNGRDEPWLMLIDAKKGGKAGIQLTIDK
jgi:tRNA1(Val) A37 N6-methylase TrmN6